VSQLKKNTIYEFCTGLGCSNRQKLLVLTGKVSKLVLDFSLFYIFHSVHIVRFFNTNQQMHSNCHIFVIIYSKSHCTPTSFGPYWSIIREYISRFIKQLFDNVWSNQIVLLPAYFPCLLPHAYFPCLLPHVYFPMPTSHVYFPCLLPMPTSHAHFPCPRPMPTSHAYFPCLLPHAYFPCRKTMNTARSSTRCYNLLVSTLQLSFYISIIFFNFLIYPIRQFTFFFKNVIIL
jgi:hypothetical protein